MNDPAKLISIMKVMLSELERSLSGVSQPVDEDNDAATSNLKSRIDRLEAVLKKREDHLHRQRELETPGPPKVGELLVREKPVRG
jgi:hypothetical protein